ncbi:hypothetical protein HDU96_006346 [Phlyctochytrium bullatum]|nr:hypothetical protein HDU96_006346 [Phlyctochytrium bullatum]
MKTLAALLALLVAAPSALAAYTITFTAGSVTVSAVPADTTSARITVTATGVTPESWVGLGFPVNLANPVAEMSAADMLVLYQANGKVASVYSGPVRGHRFTPAAPAGDFVLDEAASTYANNVLTAVFTRPLNKLPTGPSLFFGAWGQIVNGAPQQHSEDAVAPNAVILDSALPVTRAVTAVSSAAAAPTGPALPTSAVAATTTAAPAPATTKSGAEKVAMGGLAGLAMVVAAALAW